MFSFISSVASFIAILLEGLIKVLNWTVFKTEALPFSLINNIHITVLQCWLLVAILLAVLFIFEFKSIRWLYVSLALTIAFTFIQWNHFFESVDQRQAIVYSVNNHQAIEFVDHGQSYFVCDSLLLNDSEKIRYHIQPNRLIHGISITEFKIPFGARVNGVNYYRWNNKTIAWVYDKDHKFPINANIDYLIVSGNALHEKDYRKVNTNCIILDGSNSKRFVTSFANLIEAEVFTHDVIKERAFIF